MTPFGPHPPLSSEHPTGDAVLAQLDNFVQEARSQGGLYRNTWDVSTLEKQIQLYHSALDCASLPAIYSADGVTPTSLYEGRVATVHIRPLVNQYQVVFHLSRQRVPEDFIKILDTTTIELDCTVPKVTCEGSGRAHHTTASLASCCVELGAAYHERYVHFGSARDLALMLSYSTLALGLSQDSQENLALALHNVGQALASHVRQKRQAASIDCAVEAHRHARHLATKSVVHEDLFSTNLAVSLIDRCVVLGSYGDLAEAIDLLENALANCRPGYGSRAQITHELARSLNNRNSRSNSLDDLNRALILLRESLTLRSPKDPTRCQSLFLLSAFLKRSFDCTGNRDHLHEAIDRAEEVTRYCAREHFVRANTLVELANLLRRRSALSNCTEDLDNAVLAARECLETHPNHPRARNGLAGTLWMRYKRSGNPNDIDEALSLHRIELTTKAPGQAGYAETMMNLATMLSIKSEYTLDIQHLDEAIVLLRQVYTLGHFECNAQEFSSMSLARCLQERFTRNQSVKDLREALRLYDTWLSSQQPGELDVKSLYALNMAEARRISFEHFNDPNDLTTAIHLLDQACHPFLRDPTGSPPQLVARGYLALGSLSSCYGLRALSTESKVDASKALSLMIKALDLIPTGYFVRSKLMFELATLYTIPSESTPSGDLAKALDTYQGAVTNATCPAATRLIFGITALEKLDRTFHLTPTLQSKTREELLKAYQTTIQLLPQVAYFGLDPHLRLRALAPAPMLATNGAACAARGGQLESAIELLENGRTVFWTQHLRLRTPLDDLPPELAEKIKSTLNQLEFAGRRAGDASVMENEARITQQRELSREFTKLVESARSLPGLDRFMLPETFASLARAARRNTILVLIATPRFCGAVLIEDPFTYPKQLCFDPALSIDNIKKMYGALHEATGQRRGAVRGRGIKFKSPKSAASKSVFESIWTSVMQPVVRALGWKKSGGRDRPRLTICATGMFTHLPFHAAGVNNEGIWDHCVPSYTPTLGVMLTADRNYTPVQKSSVSLLLAAVPKPYKWTPLPYVAEEIKLIDQCFPVGQVVHVPRQESALFTSATCEDVLHKLPRADILHLACHGYHDAQNTLNSGFVMSDKMLTITDLMRLDLPNSFLAFLSACETAKNAEAQPDQALHLAAAMLFAGFKSMIGTMWSMDDVDGPIVAKRVYEELFGGDAEFFEPDSIPYALDSAVGELRAKKVHPSRWALYIHMGI